MFDGTCTNSAKLENTATLVELKLQPENVEKCHISIL